MGLFARMFGVSSVLFAGQRVGDVTPDFRCPECRTRNFRFMIKLSFLSPTYDFRTTISRKPESLFFVAYVFFRMDI